MELVLLDVNNGKQCLEDYFLRRETLRQLRYHSFLCHQGRRRV